MNAKKNMMHIERNVFSAMPLAGSKQLASLTRPTTGINRVEETVIPVKNIKQRVRPTTGNYQR
jgi:hypothetical protein